MNALTNLGRNRKQLNFRLQILRVILILSGFLLVTALSWFSDEETNYEALLLVLFAGIVAAGWVAWYSRNKTHFSDALLASQLLIDSVILLALVWFTGRSMNPFIYYLLVIVAISASIFPPKILWAFCVGSIATYSTLMYLDFNEHLMHMPENIRLHLLAMWLNFVGSALLISFFISRLTAALQERERLLAAARERTLQNEQLIGIGTLAASTVHSLGTPLSTIAISLDELKEEAVSKETIELIQSQITRCKKTMNKLALLANRDQPHDDDIALKDLLDDIKEYFLLVNAKIQPGFHYEDNTQSEHSAGNCCVSNNYLLKPALINLIENAIQAATTAVDVRVYLNETTINLYIEDDGEGLSSDIESQLGKPLSSTKEGGLGMGVFLANSTIERLEGELVYKRDDVSKRTQFIVRIPLNIK